MSRGQDFVSSTRVDGARGPSGGRGPAAGGRADGGFTLIELMVVVLVIGILLSIAIPTFLGARERAQDRAAQSNLRNALTAAKVAFVDNGDYRGATPAGLARIEPELRYVDDTARGRDADASDESDEISVFKRAVDPGDPVTIWAGAVESDSGTCWYLVDNSGRKERIRGQESGRLVAYKGTRYAERTRAELAVRSCSGSAGVFIMYTYPNRAALSWYDT